MTEQEETEILLKAAERLRKLGFKNLADIIEKIAGWSSENNDEQR